jgi:membrane protein
MAFYHFLAIFPCLVMFLTLAAGMSTVGSGIKTVAREVIQQILPGDAAGLVQRTAIELQDQSLTPWQLSITFAGAMWAAMNGTWALIFGVNIAYEVKENRAWWKIGLTIGGLTIALALIAGLAMLVLFVATLIQMHFSHEPSFWAVRTMEWIAVLGLLMISFALVYRFGPNLKNAQWKWSTPGSLCALCLWLVSTLALRFYFGHITDYHRTYGHLNTVAMLLLWLYFTNASILVGAEMNSEIEKAAGQEGARDRSGK